MGQLNDAVKHYKRTIEIQTKAYGPDHCELGDAYSNLGQVQLQQGLVYDAEQNFKKSIEIEAKHFGNESGKLEISYFYLSKIQV